MKTALRDALDERGYTTLTPVQEAVSDPDLIGKDLLVSAQTGSGKTLGFGLAIAPTLLGEGEKFGPADAPVALIIAPTRELAMQVKRELAWVFAKAGAVLASCVGGMDMRDERRALARGAHIVVATPGRLRDHIMRSSIDLDAIRSVVLDEADEMLDLGFREDLEFILGNCPDDRQTLMFSATVPKSIAALAQSYQKDAQRIVTKSEKTQHADIEYRAMVVADRDTENAVINTLLFYRSPNAIVFGNTRAMVNRMTTRLSNRGFKVVALSGELSQSERTHALQAMRDGRAQVCVATDVAARGIDLPNLDLVVHAELPSSHETLLHRSGRTGRAGRKGVSALIVTKRTRKKAERILGMAKLRAEWVGAPTAKEVQEREENRMFADPNWHIPADEAESVTVQKLAGEFSPEQLAAAYLRLYRAERSVAEELSDVDAAPEPRPEFGPSTWFSIPGGRSDHADPRRLLPMICKGGGLDRRDIGAIRIKQDKSFFEVREQSVAAFVKSIGPDMVIEKGVVATMLDGAPDFGPDRAGGSRPKGKSAGQRKDRQTKKWDENKPKGRLETRDDRPKKPKYQKDTGAGAKEDRKPTAKPAKRADGKPHGKETRPSDYKKPEGRKQDGSSSHGREFKKSDRTEDRPRKPKLTEAGRRAASQRWDPKAKDGKSGGNAAPRRRADGTKPKFDKRKDGDRKGPPPPKGKPNSKKNKARAAAKKLAATKKGPRRGD